MNYPVFSARTLSCLLFVLSTCILSAQLSEDIPPQSSRMALLGLPTIKVMPPIDLAALQARDLIEDQYNQPTRFAKPFPVKLGFKDGTWNELANGDRVWRLEIHAPGAQAMTLLYDKFYLPRGATLHLYNPLTGDQMGAFTSRNNNEVGRFATGLLAGDVTILEYYEPLAQRGRGLIRIAQVGHGYRLLAQLKGLGDAGGCQVNVNCDEGADWQQEKRGVARIIVNGTETCSGTLINNTAQDATPYFLTADHCIGSLDALGNADASGYVFYWDYERPGCANTGNVPINTTSGATLVANNSNSDFALFRLTESPNIDFIPYFNGWSAVDVSTRGGVGIHHPRLDAKKISTHDFQILSDNNSGGTQDAFWRLFWDPTPNGHSVTEGGSSGSALFNADHHLIGQLFGGSSLNCSDPANDVGVYGKIAYSWDSDGNTSPQRRLRDWLDPDNTGVNVIDGAFIDQPPPSVGFTPGQTINLIKEGGNTMPAPNGDCRPFTDTKIFVSATYQLPNDFTAGLAATGNAVAGADYEITPASLTLTSAESSGFFNLRVYDDQDIDGDKQLNLFLSGSGGDIQINGNDQMSITLADDDTPITPTRSKRVLTADFNDGTIPGNWTVEDGGTPGSTWFVTPAHNGGNSLDGSSFVIMDSDAIGNGTTADETLISPAMNLASATAIELSFDHFFRAYTQGGQETATVEVYDGNQWINVFSLSQQSGDVGSWAAPDQPTLDLSAYANPSFRLRFRYTAAFDWWWALDNIIVNADLPINIPSEPLAEAVEIYLGPNALVPIVDPITGTVLAEIENLTATDHGCTQVNLERGVSETGDVLYSNAVEQAVLSRAVSVEPANSAATANYRIRYFMRSKELQLWSDYTGVSSGELGMLKISGIALADVTPANFAGQDTDWQPITTGTVGDFLYAEAVFTSGFSTFLLSRNPAASLPVDWLSFTGRRLNTKANELRWQTAREEANAGFQVETARDGLNFQALAQVTAGNNPTENQTYTFLHQLPPAGTNFYRIRQTDLDGSISYSDIISLAAGEEEEKIGRVLVSPVRGQRLSVKVTEQVKQLTVFDASGRQLLQQTVTTAGRLDLLLPAAVASGVYFVRFEGRDGEMVTDRLLVR